MNAVPPGPFLINYLAESPSLFSMVAAQRSSGEGVKRLRVAGKDLVAGRVAAVQEPIREQG